MNVILSPLISEKSMMDASKGKFTFKVSPEADKTTIKSQIETMFKVNVTKVATVTTRGRSVVAGKRRNLIIKSPFKKAIVTLKAGQKIGLFDTSTQQ